MKQIPQSNDSVETREDPNHRIIASFDKLYTRKLWGDNYFATAIFNAIKSELDAKGITFYNSDELFTEICKSICASIRVRNYVYKMEANEHSVELDAHPELTNVIIGFSGNNIKANLGIMFNAIFDRKIYPNRALRYDVIVMISITPRGKVKSKTISEGRMIGKESVTTNEAEAEA